MVTLKEIITLINVQIACKPNMGMISNKVLSSVLKKIVEYAETAYTTPEEVLWDLQRVTEEGNLTTNRIRIAEALDEDEAVTLGQVIELIGESGTLFQIQEIDEDDHVEIDDQITTKVVVDRDITIGGLTTLPGMKGKIILVQNDLGGHIMTLAEDNEGEQIVRNTLPRAVTELTYIRTDNSIFWQSRVLSPGIEPTTKPTVRVDNFYKTIEVFHSLPMSEVLVSINGGPWEEWEPYVPDTDPLYVGPVNRPANWWAFKIKEAPGRIESAVAYSLPMYAETEGFDYEFNFNLS